MKRFAILFSLIAIFGLGLVAFSMSGEKKTDAKALKITVFVDEVAAKDLKQKNIAISDVLKNANHKYALQSLDIHYDIASLKIKDWQRVSIEMWKQISHGDINGSPFWFDPKPISSKEHWVLIESQKVIEAEFRERKTDVLIFIVGNIAWNHAFSDYDYLAPHGSDRFFNPDLTLKRRYGTIEMWAILYYDYAMEKLKRSFVHYDGRGAIIIGTGKIIANSKFSDTGTHNRKTLLNIYSNLIQHEQGHLFGLNHVEKKNALMNPVVDKTTEDAFDNASLLLIKKRL